MDVLPDIPHVAIMDTAWHQTMPASSYMYALPYEWYEKYGVRRYGFHGTSFLYVAKRAALLLGKDPFDCNLVCLHIGNGVSANAIKNGVSYDTSMGLTPLEGLVMGTRAGDHDAAIDLMVMEKEGIAPGKMNDILNKKSGLLGITGKYTDRRDVQKAAEAGDARAQLAIDVESYRIKKYIGAYSAAIGGADAIVFTAGVGEMSDLIREKSLRGPGVPGHQARQGKEQAGQDPQRRDRDLSRGFQGQGLRHPDRRGAGQHRGRHRHPRGQVRRAHALHLPLPVAGVRQLPARAGFRQGVRGQARTQSHPGQAQEALTAAGTCPSRLGAAQEGGPLCTCPGSCSENGDTNEAARPRFYFHSWTRARMRSVRASRSRRSIFSMSEWA